MSITVLYFASFREALNCTTEVITLDENLDTVYDLKQFLARRTGVWSDVFDQQKNVLVSINQTMAKNHSGISDNDEIAFFPPVTGG